LELATTPAGLHLVIRDDGVGLAPEVAQSKLSHGILGMRERVISLGGEFSIQGVAGSGTTIEIFMPHVQETPPADSVPVTSENSREGTAP
jgi:signal transduction histidine kinase